MGEVTLLDVHGDMQRLKGQAVIPCAYCGNPFLDNSYQEILEGVLTHVGEIDVDHMQGDHPLGTSGISPIELAYGVGCAAELMEARSLFLGKVNTIDVSPAQRRQYLEIWDSYWLMPIGERGRINDYLIAALSDSEECDSCTDSEGHSGVCTE